MHSARMVFHGRLNPTSFAAFMRARARRLNLRLVTVNLTKNLCEVEVTGQVGLVDAFEMACSLGPTDCLVLAVERAEMSAVAA